MSHSRTATENGTEQEPATTRAWLAARVAEHLRMSPADLSPDTPLSEYGLDSVYALSVAADLEDRLGVMVDPTVLWDNPTLNALCAAVEPPAPPTADPVGTADLTATAAPASTAPPAGEAAPADLAATAAPTDPATLAGAATAVGLARLGLVDPADLVAAPDLVAVPGRSTAPDRSAAPERGTAPERGAGTAPAGPGEAAPAPEAFPHPSAPTSAGDVRAAVR
ncbi:phosphopantetheine-binding protein [Streptomyces sp. NPDC017254]|uniref:acyl carrier protein n=1 Tax=unclassified Streptomyces TaxID=2593676 RepID=UPI0037A62771